MLQNVGPPEETGVPCENLRLSVERWLTLFTEVSWVRSDDRTQDLRCEKLRRLHCVFPTSWKVLIFLQQNFFVRI
jgi:hypothetical protein